jgi:hypothetical protein
MKNIETTEKEKTKKIGEHPYWARPIRGRRRRAVVVRANTRCIGAPEEGISSHTCRWESWAGPDKISFFVFLPFHFLFLHCFFFPFTDIKTI